LFGGCRHISSVETGDRKKHKNDIKTSSETQLVAATEPAALEANTFELQPRKMAIV